MENKKLGILLIVIGLLVGGMFLYYNNTLLGQSEEQGCYEESSCMTIERGLTVSHIGIGIFAFIISLGFFQLFFNKTEENIMKRLEEEKEKEKFDFALKFLDSFEAKILRIVKGQDGITQNTLRLKTDMSKAKLSYVLQDLEKRGLIKRVEKGRTLSIFLKI